MPTAPTTPASRSRRHFLSHLAGTAVAVPAAHLIASMRAQGATLDKRQKSCILLWMGGGPSHMDTWDLKPESEKNGGPFRPIATSAPGIQISEHLPTVARQMKHLSVVRSLNSKEGNHDRGTYVMHTGYPPNPTVIHPSFGSICSYELGGRLPDFDLPHFISINSPAMGGGFLGMAHAPFFVQNPNAKIENLLPTDDATGRMERRMAMLSLVENRFIGEKRGQAAVDHKAVYAKTFRMMGSQQSDAFRLDRVDPRIRDRYGKGTFGQGCLMALELVKRGVSFVEVSLGGWDTHQDAFNTLSNRLLPELDKGMGALVEDLARTGLLEKTLVVWMGEFGRTPRINPDGGRDHWPRSWSVVMGGAGLPGGQVIGSTDKDGVEITESPVGVADVVATMAQSMGIDLSTEYTTPRGRPMKIVDDGGKPIPGLA